MIITVQGYKGKKNNATQLTASLAAMMAMKFNTKNLVIELIGRNIETVESMLIGVGLNEQIGKPVYVDQGIDSLLREANVGKLVKSDFDQYCLPVITNENALDICTVTSDTDSERFFRNLNDKVDVIKRIIESAENIYDNIFILLPSERTMHDFRNKIKAIEGPDIKTIRKKDKRTGKEIVEEVRLPLVDMSIVCLHQAHMKEDHVEGRKVIYCVTKFDENSWFTLQNMAQNFGFSRNPLEKSPEKFKFCKISNCTKCNDAGLRGRLATFVHENRELNIEDVNYLWTYDILNLISILTGDKVWTFTTDASWEFEKLYEKEEMLNELPDKIKETTADILDDEPISEDETPLEDILTSIVGDGLESSEDNPPVKEVDLTTEDIDTTESAEATDSVAVTDEDVENLISKIISEEHEEVKEIEPEPIAKDAPKNVDIAPSIPKPPTLEYE